MQLRSHNTFSCLVSFSLTTTYQVVKYHHFLSCYLSVIWEGKGV